VTLSASESSVKVELKRKSAARPATVELSATMVTVTASLAATSRETAEGLTPAIEPARLAWKAP
jgi:hypothetical protein